ncbi:cyclin domain-containing protein [Ophiocordyceps camponoti-floridani]|uniref:Cyclin domain-containing protein n=1 Tax=Ophiocordyceps camponoti-floridani TaxID=2030778 RepID=A0A8H4QB93_9HYPO|nr:cyclin domain-containing protein [Ophiocordyceps camponoti-floridani]
MSMLVNPLATASQLQQRFSLSALPQDLYESVFIATQCLTQAAGLLLRLPQSVTAQANVILARYWLVDSPMAHEFSDVSAASLYLIAKLGPSPRSPRDISNVYAYLASRRWPLFCDGETLAAADDAEPRFQTEGQYQAFSQRMLALEVRILSSLSFDTHVALPHPLAITYLQTLDFVSKPKAQASLRTIQYLNTALLSPQMLYLTHQPHALATAAIYIAARDLGAKMPDCDWWEVLDVDREELGFLIAALRSLEGWWRKRREDLGQLGLRMLTRKGVEDEVRRRGLNVDDGRGGNEEERVMKLMDNM